MDVLRLVENCYQKLPQEMKVSPWLVTDHGRKVLENDTELNAYIAAYGEMHAVKCYAALQNFPFRDLESYSYDIFDWGCGQGIATLTLLEMLHDRQLLSRLNRIYLIEPSELALKRAQEWVREFASPGATIVPINKYIPSDVNSDIPEISSSAQFSINLFSNILDIRSLSLQWLANKVSSLAVINYIVCIGPKFVQNTNTRINDFCGYFNPSEYFSSIDKYPYDYTSRTHHAYGCETKCFVHKRETGINNEYSELASDAQFIDPYDYDASTEDPVVHMYNRLQRECDRSYQVFLTPSVNCDEVDLIVASKSRGIVLINVCNDLSKVEEDFRRIDTIKENLFNIHLRSIKIDSVTASSVYNCIKTALYFPGYTEDEVRNAITEVNRRRNLEKKEHVEDLQNKDFYEHNLILSDTSDLHYEFGHIYARGFKYDYYEELLGLISSPWHSYRDGDGNFHLTHKQDSFVRSDSKRLRVKGVAGCGKTQVVANRAVYQHLKTGDKVLIITFNISLIQYIRMRINQVPADFSPNKFEITNYHQFFKSKANQYVGGNLSLSDFDNPRFFDTYREKISKYNSIIIDEVQDFKTSWLQSIIKNFLAENGSVSLFGDGVQNIYDREYEVESKMPSLKGCGFQGGPWPGISERISLRLINPNIAHLSAGFARRFISTETEPLAAQEGNMFETFFIKYWNIAQNTPAKTLSDNIRWILQEHSISPKDTVVLGQSVNILRDIEAAYVNATNARTMITFETLAQYNAVCANSSSYYIHKDLEDIRRTAKTHFTTACNALKMATIHSFKGWESKTVILILQPEINSDEQFDGYSILGRENIPALIYTALTRARCNLFILNLNNPIYNDFFSKNIEQ